MTRADLISEMAAQAGLPKTAAEKALDAMTAAMIKALSSGDPVYINTLGTFKVVHRGAHPACNPRTGEPITVPASKTVKLAPSKHLKDAVNG